MKAAFRRRPSPALTAVVVAVPAHFRWISPNSPRQRHCEGPKDFAHRIEVSDGSLFSERANARFLRFGLRLVRSQFAFLSAAEDFVSQIQTCRPSILDIRHCGSAVRCSTRTSSGPFLGVRRYFLSFLLPSPPQSYSRLSLPPDGEGLHPDERNDALWRAENGPGASR